MNMESRLLTGPSLQADFVLQTIVTLILHNM